MRCILIILSMLLLSTNGLEINNVLPTIIIKNLSYISNFNIEYKEEIIYPDFRIRLPEFTNTHDKELWISKINNCDGFSSGFSHRGFLLDDWAYYKNQRGENIIYNNSMYYNYPPIGWQDEHCMDYNYNPQFYSYMNDISSCQKFVDKLVISHTPDSYSFQHILDRSNRVLLQNQHLWKNKSDVIFTSEVPHHSYPHGKFILDKLNVNQFHNVNTNQKVCAKQIIFSCKTPRIHPYQSLLLNSIMNINNKISLTEKKIILYLSRTTDKQTYNGGRKVINEAELIYYIKQLLTDRNKKERLIFYSDLVIEFNNDLSLIQKYISENVLCILGSHGGAWYHHRWAGENTLLIELLPSKHHAIYFWEESSMYNQRYFPLIFDSQEHNDMIVNIEKVVNIMKDNLGILNDKSIIELL
jgi:hypothetical protein